MESPRHSEVDGHQIRIRTLESELDFLQDRTRATIEQLQEHQARLAQLQGTIISIPRYGACE